MHPVFLTLLGHSEVSAFLVAVGIVAVLEVVNIKVAPVLEGVVVEVASTSLAVVSGTCFLEVVDVKVDVFLVGVRLVA